MLLSELQYDGVVIDLGHEMTQLVPFSNGHASFHQANTFPVGGLCIDALFLKELEKTFNKRPNKFDGYEIRREYKEKLSTVCLGIKEADKNKPYTMPDGKKIPKLKQDDPQLLAIE